MKIEQDHKDYLDWRNNYLTIEVFAEHRGWSIEHAANVIKQGRAIHDFNQKIDKYIVDVMAGKS